MFQILVLIEQGINKGGCRIPTFQINRNLSSNTISFPMISKAIENSCMIKHDISMNSTIRGGFCCLRPHSFLTLIDFRQK